MPGSQVKIAPSILSADFSRLGEQIAEVEKAGAASIHIDVMDGHFVPSITIGIPVVASLRSCTKLPFDVHLMIKQPEKYISQFIDAGADIVTVHVEACKHLHRVITVIKERGIKAGVSLNPATPPAALGEILPYVDLVLVMTVNPGFGGQTFIPGMLPKIACLRRMIDGQERKIELEVDGGVTADNAPDIVKAGANILVAGSAIFGDERGAREALRKLRGSLL